MNVMASLIGVSQAPTLCQLSSVFTASPFLRTNIPSRRRSAGIVAVFPSEPSELPVPESVTYKRSAVQTHYECQTTLESLGMKQFSAECSRTLATSMGIVNKSTSSSGSETPVGISYDVSRTNKFSGEIRLNGIVKTAVCVLCDRCLSPHPARVFSTFSLLLSREPVEEPTEQSIGVAFGEEPEAGEPVLDIDLDDKLHFPEEAKVMDISTYIRDTIHLEIPFFSICSSSCKGLCPMCGFNLNTSDCSCSAQAKEQVYTKFKTKV